MEIGSVEKAQREYADVKEFKRSCAVIFVSLSFFKYLKCLLKVTSNTIILAKAPCDTNAKYM